MALRSPPQRPAGIARWRPAAALVRSRHDREARRRGRRRRPRRARARARAARARRRARPITVIAPEREFVPRPLLVVEPLADVVARRRPLREIADEAGFGLVPDAVVAVEPERRRVVLRSGATVTYDTLVLAPGATRLPAFDDAIHIGAEGALDPLRAEIVAGTVASVAFVAPTLTGWLLPLYEAALLTAALGVRVTLVTPEERPLELFGEAASAEVAAALAAAGVEFTHQRRSTPTASSRCRWSAARASPASRPRDPMASSRSTTTAGSPGCRRLRDRRRHRLPDQAGRARVPAGRRRGHAHRRPPRRGRDARAVPAGAARDAAHGPWRADRPRWRTADRQAAGALSDPAGAGRVALGRVPDRGAQFHEKIAPMEGGPVFSVSRRRVGDGVAVVAGRRDRPRDGRRRAGRDRRRPGRDEARPARPARGDVHRLGRRAARARGLARAGRRTAASSWSCAGATRCSASSISSASTVGSPWSTSHRGSDALRGGAAQRWAPRPWGCCSAAPAVPRPRALRDDPGRRGDRRLGARASPRCSRAHATCSSPASPPRASSTSAMARPRPPRTRRRWSCRCARAGGRSGRWC